MVAQAHTHNKSNEITDIDNTTGSAWVDPTYDDAGNTTKAPSPLNPTATKADQNYTYDAWNRLVKVATNTVTLAEYAYDARGFRVQKKEYAAGSHDETRDYYYTSQWQCIEERITDVATSTTTLDRQYIWGLRYVDDLVRRDRDTTGNGTLDETLYALNDRQFNVVALWDETANGGSGGVVERMAYDPYGDPQFLNEDFTTKASSSYDWNTLFQGLPYDEESGLYNNRARMLHPLLGRFLQRDPLGYPDGLNAYAAYHVMWGGVDPTGLRENLIEKCIEGCQLKHDAAARAGESFFKTVIREAQRQYDRLTEWAQRPYRQTLIDEYNRLKNEIFWGYLDPMPQSPLQRLWREWDEAIAANNQECKARCREGQTSDICRSEHGRPDLFFKFVDDIQHLSLCEEQLAKLRRDIRATMSGIKDSIPWNLLSFKRRLDVTAWISNYMTRMLRQAEWDYIGCVAPFVVPEFDDFVNNDRLEEFGLEEHFDDLLHRSNVIPR